MPSKRRFFRAAGLGGIAALAGCSRLPSAGGPTTKSGDCDQTADVDAAQYDFSRGGQIRAKPESEPDEQWTTVSLSTCLHRDVLATVERARERGDVALRDLTASEREAVRRNLHAQLGVTRPKFYVDYRGATFEVTVIQND